MNFKFGSILFSTLFVLSITGCQQNESEISENSHIEVKEITSFEKLGKIENHLLGLPIRLKYDHYTQHLFIQDLDHLSVIELDDSSNVVNTFGSRGRGPGEIQDLTNFFLTQEHLFIVDSVQNLIHKYSRRDGQYISSLDYRNLLPESKNSSDSKVMLLAKPPFMDNNKLPFVTRNETILLPSEANGKFLYQAINWEGKKMADIGEILTKCNVTEDDDKIRLDLENREVPARDLCLAFPVNDHSNPEEIFLVYSAIPKIAKYTLSGEKIWEQNITRTPEVDSLMIDLSNIVKSRPNLHSSNVPVRKYITGRSSPDGNLYLITYTNLHTPIILRPLWMHQFDSRGNLMNRYKIISDKGDSYYFPGVDYINRKVFVPMHGQADVRVYYF